MRHPSRHQTILGSALLICILLAVLVPALALAQGDSDESVMTEREAILEEEIAALKAQLDALGADTALLDARLDLVDKNVAHVHVDAHDALGTQIDDVDYMRGEERTYDPSTGIGRMASDYYTGPAEQTYDPYTGIGMTVSDY